MNLEYKFKNFSRIHWNRNDLYPIFNKEIWKEIDKIHEVFLLFPFIFSFLEESISNSFWKWIEKQTMLIFYADFFYNIRWIVWCLKEWTIIWAKIISRSILERLYILWIIFKDNNINSIKKNFWLYYDFWTIQEYFNLKARKKNDINTNININEKEFEKKFLLIEEKYRKWHNDKSQKPKRSKIPWKTILSYNFESSILNYKITNFDKPKFIISALGDIIENDKDSLLIDLINESFNISSQVLHWSFNNIWLLNIKKIVLPNEDIDKYRMVRREIVIHWLIALILIVKLFENDNSKLVKFLLLKLENNKI